MGMTASFKRTFDLDITVDPELLARLFSEMDSDSQARFLMAVARRFSEFPDPAADVMQMEYIADDLKRRADAGPTGFDDAESVAAARRWVEELHERIRRDRT